METAIIIFKAVCMACFCFMLWATIKEKAFLSELTLQSQYDHRLFPRSWSIWLKTIAIFGFIGLFVFSYHGTNHLFLWIPEKFGGYNEVGEWITVKEILNGWACLIIAVLFLRIFDKYTRCCSKKQDNIE